jgi:hypothetical protein
VSARSIVKRRIADADGSAIALRHRVHALPRRVWLDGLDSADSLGTPNAIDAGERLDSHDG